MTWNRFAATLTATAIAIGVFAFARGTWLPQTHWEIQDDENFWLLKIYQPPLFDMVLLGDSRVVNAAAPSVLRETLPEFRILNFGFSQATWNRPYLDSGREKLDPAGARKTLVLGVSPYSLTAKSAETGSFDLLRSKSRSEFLLLESLHGIRPYFDQVIDSPLAEYWRNFSRMESSNLKREFFRDGWQPVILAGPTEGDARESYQNLFRGTKVSVQIARGLMETVRRWTGEGIRVFGYRAPTAEEIRMLEAEMLGFEEESFVAQFREAGGTWLPLPNSYGLFDGDHLHKESAVRFSRDLANAMREGGK